MTIWLADRARPAQRAPMFAVSESDATAIRTAFNAEGELSAAIEVRRLFPGVQDNTQARDFARIIAGWEPPVAPPATVTRMVPRGGASR